MPRSSGHTLTVGDLTITALSDGRVVFDPRMLFPQTPLDAWAPYYDVFPEYFEGQLFNNNLGSFVIQSGDRRVMADTGFGPHGEMLGYPAPGELMKDMARRGVQADEIDTVFLTHLHGDHVGWNMREDSDPSRQSFPNARYMVHEADWVHFTSDEMLATERGVPTRRSVMPLRALGALELMSGETDLAPGVRAIPTPGHTPGHMSLLLSSKNERALLIGDILGSPMQATETDFPYSPDWDGPMGRDVRQRMLDLAEEQDMVVLGSHLSAPGWGTLVRWRGRRYWRGLRDS